LPAIEERYQRYVQRAIDGLVHPERGLKHGWAYDAFTGERLRG
jgi:hypothetical protein